MRQEGQTQETMWCPSGRARAERVTAAFLPAFQVLVLLLWDLVVFPPCGSLTLCFLIINKSPFFFLSKFDVSVTLTQGTLFFIYFEFLNFIFLYSRFLLVIYFIHISVYMSIPISQFIPPPPPTLPLSPLGVHTFILYIWVSITALQTGFIHTTFLGSTYMRGNIYDICFSLSDLLHSVWRSLDPSTSLQITQFCSFLWLSNIPLYICTTSSLSIRLLISI